MSAVRRFVLLRHAGHGPTHFDFMIENGAALATWQFDSAPPLLAASDTLACRRLTDHRAAYLDFEGPVNGNRGNVSRVDTGTCEVITASEDTWVLTLHGIQLCDRFTLTRHADTWNLTRTPAALDGIHRSETR